jgi:anaerobic magnesium-protoporphyrin IX monomethyl ester cyclase
MSKNGNVLFIIHDLYQDDNHFPLGIGYLAAVLRKKDVDVEVYCQDIFHYSNEELAVVLKKGNYDLICVGFLAARFQETVLDLCKCVNKHKKSAWLVLGGHGPSPIPEYVLEQTHADAIILGEGEESLPELLKCKLEGGDQGKIKGIAYMEDGIPKATPRRKPVHDLDSIPFPEWSLFPIEQYIKSLKLFRYKPKDRCFGMLTSRGCINRCNFCYRMEKGIRFRSIKNVIEEISLLNEQYGINYFLMNDELFVYPKKRIFEFRDELEKTCLKIKFVCNARVDVFDEEVAGCLKEVGCQFLNFGMESSDQNVLDLMNKHTTVEENIRAAEIAKKAEIGLGLNFIWGNIGDTAESLKNNTELIKKYTTYDYIRTIRPVTPYPGCDLYYEAIKRGLLEGPDDFFKKFKNSDLLLVNFTEIPEKKFYELLFAANKDLILDYYEHTSKDTDAANKLIDDFYRLYFKGETQFRGARHYKTSKK